MFVVSRAHSIRHLYYDVLFELGMILALYKYYFNVRRSSRYLNSLRNLSYKTEKKIVIKKQICNKFDTNKSIPRFEIPIQIRA